MPLCVNTPHWKHYFSLQIFLPLGASNFQCHFKKLNHFTDTLSLFPQLNHLSTFFISLLSYFFPWFFSSCNQVAHCYHQINVEHIKDIYCIEKLILHDACGTEHRRHGYWILGQINLNLPLMNLYGDVSESTHSVSKLTAAARVPK